MTFTSVLDKIIRWRIKVTLNPELGYNQHLGMNNINLYSRKLARGSGDAGPLGYVSSEIVILVAGV